MYRGILVNIICSNVDSEDDPFYSLCTVLQRLRARGLSYEASVIEEFIEELMDYVLKVLSIYYFMDDSGYFLM